MISTKHGMEVLRASIVGALLCGAAGTCLAQVSPAEISDAQLKAAEQAYLQQLIQLNREIQSTSFPFPFNLSRYVGLDPGQQPGTDARGLEFVSFHGRVVLKVTGNYNAAYADAQLTANERAARTLRDVVAPILGLLAHDLPQDVTCDGIGFEVSYHVRSRERSYEYEGKEILVAILDKPDAFGYPGASSDETRQAILNRSEIYLNGKEFGLALNGRAPLDPSALARNAVPDVSVSSAAAANARAQLAKANPALLPDSPGPAPQAPGDAPPGAGHAAPGAAASHAPPPTPAQAEQLQTQYESQLQALAKEGIARFHFVDYAAPSFAIFRNQLVLQLTLRNTLQFQKGSGSIYKRAAQSFDLFLAPQFKDLLEKLPADAPFEAIGFTVLNQLGPEHASSEALEFICPRKALQDFADAAITNQQLIDQSVVLVNGVRIALNLQLVE